MQFWNSARKNNHNRVCTFVCFYSTYLTNPSSDGDEVFHPCTQLDEYRQLKKNQFIDFF